MSFEFSVPKVELSEQGQKPELPRELIELVENAPLDPFEKMELLLIKTRKKPMTDIELFSQGWEAEGGKSEPVDRQKLLELEKLLEKLELVAEVQEPYIDEYARRDDEDSPEIAMRREKIGIFIGNDEDSLKKFHEALKSSDDEEMGRFFGYPQTCIEAYLGKRESVRRQDLPEHVKKAKFYPFIQFGVLSKDNWQEEIKVAKEWADTVEKNSPKLFQEYTRYSREVVSNW